MAILKDRIYRATCRSERASVFAALLAKLRSENFEIDRQDPEKGEILIRCESLLINWIFWRCWSDKLLFEVSQDAQGKTVVQVYALPNLFRISAKKGEVRDPRLMISRLALEQL